MPVRTSRLLLEALLGAAAATPHSEVCGLLFGEKDRIEAFQPTDNVAARPRDAFEIDPRALFTALRAERASGPRLIGHYHSHPNGRAEPSAADLAASEPGKLWLILGGGIARLWLAEAGAFREMQLIVT